MVELRSQRDVLALELTVSHSICFFVEMNCGHHSLGRKCLLDVFDVLSDDCFACINDQFRERNRAIAHAVTCQTQAFSIGRAYTQTHQACLQPESNIGVVAAMLPSIVTAGVFNQVFPVIVKIPVHLGKYCIRHLGTRNPRFLVLFRREQPLVADIVFIDLFDLVNKSLVVV